MAVADAESDADMEAVEVAVAAEEVDSPSEREASKSSRATRSLLIRELHLLQLLGPPHACIYATKEEIGRENHGML